MAKKRTSPGKNGEAVLREYNHRCSICGADRPHLHHIDENPSNQDPMNLLPLCPNCHLTDQHNPTARIDPRLLRLFRAYKDPTILAPQFVPLFRRFAYLDDMPLWRDELIERANELVGFVSQLEMGEFYAAQISRPTGSRVLVLPESPEDQRRREQEEQLELLDYRQRVTGSREVIEGLVIELLRYQHWCMPTPKRPPA